jgi:hypothetical protein
MLSAQQRKIAVWVGVVLVLALGAWMILRRRRREGYTRTCLEGNCSGFARTQVDYAFTPERQPEWLVNPSSRRQPLAEGNPVDLLADERKLGTDQMFAQYRNDWAGCGEDGLTSLKNDSKNRFDLINNGELGLRRIMTLEDNEERFYVSRGSARPRVLARGWSLAFVTARSA